MAKQEVHKHVNCDNHNWMLSSKNRGSFRVFSFADSLCILAHWLHMLQASHIQTDLNHLTVVRDSSSSEKLAQYCVIPSQWFLTKQQHFTLGSAQPHHFSTTLMSSEALVTTNSKTMASFRMLFLHLYAYRLKLIYRWNCGFLCIPSSML